MKKNKHFIFVLAFFFYTVASNAQKADPKYLSEVAPGEKPGVFASGKISQKDQFEFGAVFSKDRSEFYYGVEINGKAETRMVKFENGKWSSPIVILTHNVYNYNDPFLTPDEKKLFFISDRPLSGQGPKKDYDIWFIERQSGKWSEPINAGKNINSEKNEYYISFTKSGKMYFSSDVQGNHDIYSSELKNSEFQPSTKLD